MGRDQHLVNTRDGYLRANECDAGFLNELVGEQALLDNGDINPMEIFSTKFAGFVAESLTYIYYENGGELRLTIEMLSQPEVLTYIRLSIIKVCFYFYSFISTKSSMIFLSISWCDGLSNNPVQLFTSPFLSRGRLLCH